MQNGAERFLLVGVYFRRSDLEEEKISLHELEELTHTSDAEVSASELIFSRHIDPSCFITRGKAEQLALQRQYTGATGVILDVDLSPAQQRNLENLFECKVIDRTALILDIFAQHAHTREGKLQVELAQLNYILPRLRGRGAELSRLAGGIGTRGPGETKLETDRRRIKDRIHHLKGEINRIIKNRQTQRKRRLDAGIPLISIIGYTNAGKSTLMNRLSHADVYVENKLFATLDTTIRKIVLAGGIDSLVSDTVGFIKKLPTILVAAFRATLEEINFAHLLLHVVDISQPRPEREIDATMNILQELGAGKKPLITVFNKFDLVEDHVLAHQLVQQYQPSAAISALRGDGIEDLQQMMAHHISDIFRLINLHVPYSEISRLHQVLPSEHYNLSMEYLPEYIKVQARLTHQDTERLPPEWIVAQ